jgi:hypothetical protein
MYTFRGMNEREFMVFARAYQFRGMQMSVPTIEALWQYLVNKDQAGSFLHAVLCNDLKVAVGNADDYNLRNIPVYLAFLWNCAPTSAWGSPENVENWLKGTD